MKLPVFLSKPRWLSKDAATRLLALEHDNDSDLVANLGRLAREDADAKVRIAAMKRLADPGIAQGVAHDDADPLVRAQAHALWLDLLTGSHASAPSLGERLRLLKAQDGNDLIEHIARRAREPELRRAALERVARPALLFDRALEDADAGIRLGLVDRIDDEAQLARLAERARKTDKQVSRRARARIEALRVARGDDATLEQRARLLCERLEQLVREPRHVEVEADIARRWSEIETTAPPALHARFQTAQNLLAASRVVPTAEVAPTFEQCDPSATASANDDTAVDPPAVSAVEPAEPDGAVEALVAPLLAQARFAASLDEANAEKQQQRERQQALFGELGETLCAIESAIDSGASAQAHAAKARADGLRRNIKAPLPAALAQQLATTEARYVELSRWQQWADNQRRRQLCEEIEALATAGLHPDAVASRVREAQLEWTRLDATEGRDAAKSGGFPRQFHAACRAALAPAQAYFRKRQELRQSHAQVVATLLDRVGTLAQDSVDWTAIGDLRRDVVEALRGLDRVQPSERKTLAQRLKISLSDLDARVARRDEDIERAKSELIAQAEALSEGTPQRGAIATARELQQRWQRAGNGRRARDQAQWKMFRAAIDAVFAGLDADRDQRNARDAEERKQAETLCAEMEAFANSEAPTERGAITRVQSAWNGLRVRDEVLVQRFAAAQARLRDESERRERTRRHARFDAWLVRYRLCRFAERAPASELRTQWDAAPAGEIAAAELAARFEAAAQASRDVGVAVDSDGNALRDVLIALEVLAGIDSPPEDLDKRRMLQVDRLSARLRSNVAAMPADQELAALLVRWTTLGDAAEPGLEQRLERALAAAIETLP